MPEWKPAGDTRSIIYCTCLVLPGPDEGPRSALGTSFMSADLQFVDTNVLVYLFDSDSAEKQSRARQLLVKEAASIVLSTQVLGEFYVTVTRKLAKPLASSVARAAVDDLCAFRVRPLRSELVRAAMRRSDESQLSYWDALIVETAIDAGTTILLTEDLQHGQEFNGLRVVDPFRSRKSNPYAEKHIVARGAAPLLRR